MIAFDAEKFARKVRTRLELKRLRLIDAAAESGVSKPTIFRAMHCQPINTGNFLLLCKWLGAEPFAFLVPCFTETSSETAERNQIRGAAQ